MDERARRIGLNEAVFREVNERVEELSRDLGVADETLELLCECGKASCVARFRMSPAAYQQLRSHAQRFAILPEHEIPDVETVVERHERYDVVEKHEGESARVAAETDPRR